MRKGTTVSRRIILPTRQEQPSLTNQYVRRILAVLVPRSSWDRPQYYPKSSLNLRVNVIPLLRSCPVNEPQRLFD